MIHRYFLRTLLLSIIGIILIIISFILITDPYSLLSDKPLFWRHALRFEDPWRDGRAMRLAVLLRQPRTIILGSSRVALGLDARRLKATPYWPAYNAATYNSSLAHRLSMLKYAAYTDHRLKHVFIEISPIDVIHAADFWRLEPVKFNLNLLSDTLPLIFSDTAIRDAIRVLWETMENQNVMCADSNCGQPRLRRTGGNAMGLKIIHESALVSYRLFSPIATVDPTWGTTLNKIISACHKHDLDCKFFISPLNARILYGYQRFNQWNEIESMITHLATIKNTYNFLWYNYLTDEPIQNSKSEWIDSIHYSTVIGDTITDAIAGRIAEKTKEGKMLWSILTPDTLNVTLKELRASRDAWFIKHPETPWSYENLEKNLKDPPLANSKINFSDEMLYIEANGRKWTIKKSKKIEGAINGHQFRSASLDGDINGWAADIKNNITPEFFAITYHNAIVAWGRPWVDMSDKLQKPSLAQSGYQFVYHIPQNEKSGQQLRIFALFKNNSAIEVGTGEKLTW